MRLLRRVTSGLPAAVNGYDLVSAVNALRASSGLPAYNVNSILMTIAQNQANYLGLHRRRLRACGTRRDASVSARLERRIFSCECVSDPPGLFSENWDGLPASRSPSTCWEGDDAHRIALYSTNLVDIGGGVASGGGMTFYVIDTGTQPAQKRLQVRQAATQRWRLSMELLLCRGK